MTAHEHEPHPRQPAGAAESGASLTGLAVSATVHCLIGCSIGEVLGLVLGLAFGLGNAATVALAVALAFVSGYAMTLRPLLAGGVEFRKALGLALAADTVSIAVMEVVDNAVVLLIPGAMEAGLTDGLFWFSLALGLGLAFVAALPVNRWLISRGRGHAVIHDSHHHEHHQPA